MAYSAIGQGKACLFASLGPLSPVPISNVPTSHLGSVNVASGNQNLSSPTINITINKTISKSRKQRSGTLVITTDIPSVCVGLNKPLLDGLQYWVDDVSQLVERTFGERLKDSASERGLSRNSSLLGSHYFAQSSGESESGISSKPAGESAGETIVKLSVAEGL